MIPLVLVLWEHPEFRGRKRLFTTSVSDLSQFAFNDTASAIGVHPGPDYASFKAANGGREPTVAVYEHSNFGGAFSILTIGSYPNIHRMLNLGDAVSSIRFNPPPAIPGTIAPIPLVVELFEHQNFGGRRLVVVENSRNIAADFGSEFNDVASSVRITAGPNFAAGDEARLFRDTDFRGGEVELPPGDHRDLGVRNFNDVVSSIIVR